MHFRLVARRREWDLLWTAHVTAVLAAVRCGDGAGI